jgi:hypothetical protein
MALNHKWKGIALFGTLGLAVAGWALTPAPLHAAAIPSGTVFTTYADNSGIAGAILMLEKDKDPVQFGMLDPGTEGNWVAPIGFSPDGHLYLGSKAGNGSIYDVTAGGDRSADKPITTGMFPVLPHKMAGMVFDAEGNAYVSMGQAEDSTDNQKPYSIVRVNLKTGAKSNLNGTFDHAWGLVIRPDANKNEILYIAEGNQGRVLTYNLTTDKLDAKPLATGFPHFTDHGAMTLAFDPRGHLFTMWRLDPNDENGGGVFDITNGGDFSDITKTPPAIMYPNRMDVNGMVFDSKNNLLFGGDNTNQVWISPFDASTGKFGDFVPFTSTDNGGGDTETVTIVP